MKKIIVPVDFSKHSEYALEAASILAKKHNAEILALHMLELSHAIFLTQSSDAQLSESVFLLKLAEKKFDAFLNKDYLKGITVKPIVKHFKVFSEINDIAAKHDADLIIMGSHGSSGLKEIFIGSNTEKVVRHSNIPVLIIKHRPNLMDFETIVFACDFSDHAIKPYLNATTLFKKLKSKVYLLYVNTPNESFKSSVEMEKQIADFLIKANGNINDIENVKYTSDYTVEKGIMNYSNLLGADLIAIATHGRTGLAHLLSGSISEDIANHSEIPVMTFKI